MQQKWSLVGATEITAIMSLVMPRFRQLQMEIIGFLENKVKDKYSKKRYHKHLSARQVKGLQKNLSKYNNRKVSSGLSKTNLIQIRRNKLGGTCLLLEQWHPPVEARHLALVSSLLLLENKEESSWEGRPSDDEWWIILPLPSKLKKHAFGCKGERFNPMTKLFLTSTLSIGFFCFSLYKLKLLTWVKELVDRILCGGNSCLLGREKFWPGLSDTELGLSISSTGFMSWACGKGPFLILLQSDCADSSRILTRFLNSLTASWAIRLTSWMLLFWFWSEIQLNRLLACLKLLWATSWILKSHIGVIETQTAEASFVFTLEFTLYWQPSIVTTW